MLLEQGWLVGARRVPSPHYDCRPDDETPHPAGGAQY